MNAKIVKKSMILGSLFLFLAVLFGAFGAHGLERIVQGAHLKTFETGVRYQFYHGFALLFISLLSRQCHMNLNKVIWFFTIGIVLFSFNCYLYVLTSVKFFAMLVPIGGVFFLIGWMILLIKSIKEEV